MVFTRFIQEYLMHSVYYAPRGRRRLQQLGASIAQRYLSPEDRLVGLIGDAGAGKSLLIRGMFPGLELTNDDDGINIRPLPLLRDAEMDDFSCHTYHLDLRFEAAFTPLWQLSQAVAKTVRAGRRVIIEHFDMLYEHLGINAEVLIGIGEEVIVTRPGVFGPEPGDIAKIVFDSLQYRRMAHSAEDITSMVLEDMGLTPADVHSDVYHGFMLEFETPPEMDLEVVEAKVKEIITADLPISFMDDKHITIGERVYPCTGPRIHLNRSGEITGFRLLKEVRLDPIQNLYAIIGMVGAESDEDGKKSAQRWLLECHHP